MLFGNIIRTDGFSVDFLFYKRRRVTLESAYQTFDLSLDDFSLSEVEQTYVPIFLDPNRKSVFSAMVGIQEQQIRKCSMKEYYHLTGSTKLSKELESLKKSEGVEPIESSIPSPKTSNISKHHDYVSHIMSNLDTLLEFYGPRRAKDRFTLYQGKQRAMQLMVNMLTHGTSKYDRSRRNRSSKRKKRRKKRKKNSRKKKENEITVKKYINSLFLIDTNSNYSSFFYRTRKWKTNQFVQPKDKVPLVVFGAGMFGKDNVKIKGLRCGLVGKFYKALKRREAEGGLIVSTINEYNTSKLCSLCHSTLGIVNTKDFKGSGVLACKECQTVWQRDVNASLNMMTISLSIWSNKGRPTEFTPPKKRSP